MVGIEPEPTLRAGAAPQAPALGFPLHRAPTEALPFADDSFDAVVATTVFCSIPNAALAATLAEVRRAMRPDGAFPATGAPA